jgi:hypothetical protein
MPDGLVRLYFVMAQRKSKAISGSGLMVSCAGTRDGLNYRLDDAVRIPLEDGLDSHIAAFSEAKSIRLFITGANDDLNHHHTSSDGRVFRPASWPAELQHVRSLVPIDRGCRGYLSGPDGIQSAVSPDGTKWTLESGVRLAGRWDPAVARLEDGSFVMLYSPVREPQILPAGAAPSGEAATNNVPDEDLLSKRRISAANLKGLGTCCWGYSVDHGDNMPPDFETLVQLGTSHPKSLVSPLNPDPESESYVYIPGQNTNMDSKNVLAYEKPETHGYAGTLVLFMDGHVDWMTMEQLEDVLAKTHERLGR